MQAGWGSRPQRPPLPDLYSCGSNDLGQLGHEGLQTRLELLAGMAQYRVVTVACGANHSLAVDQWGGLFSWGSDESGQHHTQTVQAGQVPGYCQGGTEWVKATEWAKARREGGIWYYFMMCMQTTVKVSQVLLYTCLNILSGCGLDNFNQSSCLDIHISGRLDTFNQPS